MVEVKNVLGGRKRMGCESNPNAKVIPNNVTSISRAERAEKIGQIQSSRPCAGAYLNSRLFL